MRNKLPILFALILMAVAAMPWLRSLESQRWILSAGTATVPPPEQAVAPTSPVIKSQDEKNPKDTSFSTPTASPPPVPIQQVAQNHGPDLAHRSGVPPGDERTVGSQPEPKNSATGQLADLSQSTPPKPQALLDCAVHAVESRKFISARVKQQGELIGHQITGEGRYYELRQGAIPSIHFELTAEVGSVSTSLVQICNGTTFWTYRKLPDGETLSKIDAVRAFTALTQAANRMPSGTIASSPGLGGSDVWCAV